MPRQGAGRENTPEVAVVVPVYRNAQTLETLAHRLHQVLDTTVASHELIFVDDACPESSLAVLNRLVEIDTRVTVLTLYHNVGQHAAVMIGLTYSRSPWTVVLDADLQDPPEAIPQLLGAAEPHIQAVFAGRRGYYESRPRLVTSRLFKTLLHWVSGVPKDAGIFVALRRDTVAKLLHLKTARPFVVAMIGCLGVAIESVPIERAKRPSGRSAYSSVARLRAASRAFACVLDCKGPAVWRRLRSSRAAPWSHPETIVRTCWAGDGRSKSKGMPQATLEEESVP